MSADTQHPDPERLLERLSSSEPKTRVYALRALEEAPIADLRLLAAAEALLGDDTICLLSIPYLFGEIRYQAAATVAALRGALKLTEPVRLQDVLVPLTPDKIGRLAEEMGLADRKGGLDGSLDALTRLRAQGLAPRRNLLRTP